MWVWYLYSFNCRRKGDFWFKKSEFLTFWPASVTLTFEGGHSIWRLWKGLVKFLLFAKSKVSDLWEKSEVKVYNEQITDRQRERQPDDGQMTESQIIDLRFLYTFIKTSTLIKGSLDKLCKKLFVLVLFNLSQCFSRKCWSQHINFDHLKCLLWPWPLHMIVNIAW